MTRFVSVDDLAGGPVSEPDDRLTATAPGPHLGHRPGLLPVAPDPRRGPGHPGHGRAPPRRIVARSSTGSSAGWSDLPEDDRRLIEQMSHRLVAGILHAPLAALNADTSGELERAARDLFSL